jgi:hypothetical protein
LGDHLHPPLDKNGLPLACLIQQVFGSGIQFPFGVAPVQGIKLVTNGLRVETENRA